MTFLDMHGCILDIHPHVNTHTPLRMHINKHADVEAVNTGVHTATGPYGLNGSAYTFGS